MAGGGGAAPAPKADELQPHPAKDQLPNVSYCITSPPPWPEAILLGFQHYLVMLGTTVIIPTALVPQMGGGNEEKAIVIQTLLFVAGLNTLLQTLFGTRLPAVMGGSYTFVVPTISIILAGRYSNIVDPHEKFNKKLRISPNPDGSLTRYAKIPVAPPTGDSSSDAALSRDVPLSKTHNTWLRIFIPNNINPSKNLPIIIYFHGGGFVLYSAATVMFHNSCEQISARLPAVVVSVEHRLAPEHRLPAAYEDAEDALLWVRDQARSPTDPWMTSLADFGRCFLMGSSSGGNIVYHLGIRALQLDLEPLNLAGLVLNQPFFGGEQRTESETRLKDDMMVPLPVADLLWELALPKGAGRDHEFSNPMTGRRREGSRGLPRCLVRGYDGDPLVDRQRGLAEMLEDDGVRVVARFEDGFHGIELLDSDKADALVDDVRRFVYENDGDHKDSVGGGGGSRDFAVVNRL